MLKWMIHRKLSAFEREHGYDASYMHEIVDRDVGAFLKFGRATGLGLVPERRPDRRARRGGVDLVDPGGLRTLHAARGGLRAAGGRPGGDDRGGREGGRGGDVAGGRARRPVRARRARARRRGRRVPRGDLAPLGAARLARAGVRRHDRAALSGPEVRARPRQGLHAGRGRGPSRSRRCVTRPRPHDAERPRTWRTSSRTGSSWRASRTACSARSPRPRTSSRTRSCAGARSTARRSRSHAPTSRAWSRGCASIG